tara:strand:- start:1391 stop:2941 length:1551 start_codon:yes stop_codon:yes gene_type:complete
MFTKSPAIDFASLGLIADLPKHKLPPGAWSESLNIRAKDGSVQGVYAFADDVILHNSNAVIANGDLIAITQFTPAGTNYLVLAYIVKGTDNFCHVVTYNTSTTTYDDITNSTADQKFTYNELYPPQIFVFNEMLIVNPANDAPPQFTNAGVTSGSLQELPNWNQLDDSSNSALICRTLRPFNNRLIAMNIFEERGAGAGDDVYLPIDVVWSSVVTSIGSLSTVQWSASSTNTAGDAFMTQTPGKILDGLQLGPYFIAYKDDAVIQVRETGDTFVLAFETIFEDDGIFSPGCVAAIGNNQHIVWGNYGIYIHDGQTQKQDIAKSIIQENLFSSVINTHRDRSFVFKQTRDNEVWFCYSETGNSGKGANKAFVFDYNTQLWHKRDIPQLLNLTETELNGVIKIYGASPDDANIQLLSTSVYTSGGYFEQSENHLGTTTFKQLTSYYPDSEAQVLLAVDGTVNIGDTPSYTNQTFNPTTSHKLDKRISGRYMNVKVTMSGAINPKLTTVSFNLKGTTKR